MAIDAIHPINDADADFFCPVCGQALEVEEDPYEKGYSRRFMNCPTCNNEIIVTVRYERTIQVAMSMKTKEIYS